MISYVLLIVFAMIIGTIVYNVLKTYVPKDVPECPEGVSIFIKEIIYTENSLEITTINNGLFDIAGYFIRATNDSSQEIATMDLSEFLKAGSATAINDVVMFSVDNPMKPNDQQSQKFGLSEEIYSIEIIPVRFQEEDNKKRFVSCGGSKVSEVVSIGVEYIECTNGEIQSCPFQEGVCSGSEKICIGQEWPACDYSAYSTDYEQPETSCSDGLDNDCDGDTDGADTDCGGTCTDGNTQLCPLQDGVCSGSQTTCSGGTFPACDYSEITGYEATESICDDGLDNDCDGSTDSSDTDCAPVSSCDGTWDFGNEDEGVECDGGTNCQADCTCETNYIPDENGGCEPCNYNTECDAGESCLCSDCEDKKDGCDEGWRCQAGACVEGIPPAVTGCDDYCIYLEIYSGGVCRQNPAQCTINGEVNEIGGDSYCLSQLTDTCCCRPQS